MSLEPGDVVEHFTILSLLGQGGMGRVYVARDTRLQRNVALKIVHPDAAPSSSGSGSAGSARLLREAQSAAALDHPNVVTIYEVGEIQSLEEERGRPFIAMELVKGRPLRAFVGDESVPVARRTKWLADVARALAAAHAAGLVHRDIKPDNVMVRDDGVIKVLDFGVAKRAATPSTSSTTTTESQDLPSLTAKGVALGTPYYMAPEQMRREPLDGRADQFSWGVLAYELLSGSPPWGRDVDALALLSKLLTEEPPPLGDLRPDLPRNVVAVVVRAMAKRRDARFATMDELVAQLEDTHGAFAATTPAVFSPILPGADGAPAQSAGSAASVARVHPARWKGMAIAASVVAVAAAIVGWRARAARREQGVDAAWGAPAGAIGAPPSVLSSNPAAAGAFSAAMQAWGDGSSGTAIRSIDRAAALDPTFAAASVRSALWSSEIARFSIPGVISPDGPRAAYALARSHRAAASDYDRALIDAVEPRFRPRPDDAESERRLVAMAERFTDRGEPLYWVALTRGARGDLAGAEDAARRAETVEPWLHPALLAARAWIARDRLPEARSLLDKCIAIAPGATDCLGQRARIRGSDGECAAMAADAHAWVASDAADARAYETLAEALFASGAPIESVRDAVDAMERRSPPEERAIMAPHHRVALALGAGDFAAAMAAARVLDESTDWSSVSMRQAATLEYVLTALEAEDKGAAAAAATRFVQRMGAWTAASPIEGVMPIGVLLHARESGALSRGDYVSRRASLLRAAESRLAGSSDDERRAIWLYGYAMAVETPDDAREAIAALGRYPPLAPVEAMSAARASIVGLVYERAGDHAAAIPLLRRGASTCFMLNAMILAMVSREKLADALAATGARDEARVQYQSVLDRWGKATPRSRTADAARAGLAALGATLTPSRSRTAPP